jgi:GR25 family glycosyltransferase involved in LPS biosynthesis
MLTEEQSEFKINSIQDIHNIIYINLKKRADRKEKVEKECEKIGIKAERFNAIEMPNGAIGCSMSHLHCLEMAKNKGWEAVWICEDDIHFTDPSLFVQQLNLFLQRHKMWDVILIAGNNTPPFFPVDDCCIKVTRCQTTTGYIVKRHYYDTLIQNIRKGLQQLIRQSDKHILYAIDKFWFSLQEKDNWFLIIPLTVTQYENYSDIEKKHTNYSRVMLDIDKRAFYLNQAKNQIQKNAAISFSLFK